MSNILVFTILANKNVVGKAVNVLIVTSDQMNASLLKKLLILQQQKKLIKINIAYLAKLYI